MEVGEFASGSAGKREVVGEQQTSLQSKCFVMRFWLGRRTSR